MGWLNTVLDVTNVALNVNNSMKLTQLHQQGQAQILVQAVLKELRDEIFRIRQAAEDVLEQETLSPRIAAAAMRILQNEIADSPITQEIFSELGDKEFVASTHRLVRSNDQRMFNALPLESQREVVRVAEASQQIQDTTYYLDHYDDAQKLKEAAATVKELQGRNSAGAMWLQVALLFGGSLLLYILLGTARVVDVSSGGLVCGSVLLIGLAVLLSYRQSGRYKKAKSLVKDMGDQVDLAWFDRVDAWVNQDYDLARKIQKDAKWVINAFFGNEQVSVEEEAPALEDIPPGVWHSAPTKDEQRPTDESSPPITIDVEASDLVEETSEPENQYCMQCGRQIPQAVSFCPYCGAKVQI